MNSYKKALLATAIVISIPSIFLIIVGVYNSSWRHMVFWGGMLLLWWGNYLNVKKGNKWAFEGSLLIIFLFWLFFFILTATRIDFVIENGGMERQDGYGSPLAFLLGLLSEQLFFIPLTITFYFGIRHFIQQRLGKPVKRDLSSR